MNRRNRRTSIVPEGEIIYVFSAAGLKQPDICIDSPIANRLTLSGLPIYVAASQHAPFSPINSSLKCAD